MRRLLELAFGAQPSRVLVTVLHEATRGYVEPAVALLRDVTASARNPVWADQQVFRREGEYWTVAYQGRVMRLRHAKGFVYLASLLRRPGTGVHVTELAGQGARDEASVQRARLAVTKAIKIALARIDAAHPGLGRHLTATIRRGYVCVYLPDPRSPIVWSE